MTDPASDSREEREDPALRAGCEEDDYVFNPTDLESTNEDARRWAIIEISRKRLQAFEPKLLNLLATEASEANRRHVVRALGSVGTPSSVGSLLQILEQCEGLILGDAAEALGKLRAAVAEQALRRLTAHPLEHVANKARWALRQLEAKGKEGQSGPVSA